MEETLRECDFWRIVLWSYFASLWLYEKAAIPEVDDLDSNPGPQVVKHELYLCAMRPTQRWFLVYLNDLNLELELEFERDRQQHKVESRINKEEFIFD